MRTWFFMLGGMVVWAAHFMGVYAIASVADVARDADAAAARWIVAGFTAACAAAAAAFGLAGLRRLRRTGDDPYQRFTATVAAVGGGIAAVAVVWQGLPALVGH